MTDLPPSRLLPVPVITKVTRIEPPAPAIDASVQRAGIAAYQATDSAWFRQMTRPGCLGVDVRLDVPTGVRRG